MRKKNQFWKSLMLGLASVTVVACSSDDNLADMPASPDEAQPKISLKVATPRTRNYVVEGGAESRTDAIHTEAEWTVNTLNVYIFQKADDGSYTYYSTTEFNTETGSANLLTKTADANYTCELAIEKELLGKTVQVLLLANETGTVTCDASTTIDVFKGTLADENGVSDGSHADYLVGYVDASTNHGFAMSAQAVVTNDTDNSTEKELVLTAKGVDVKASLMRNVARIDIQNDTPNLTITGVKAGNTVDNSYLFAQYDTDGTTQVFAAPQGAVTIGVLPTLAYYTDDAFTAIAYDDAQTGADNEHEHVLYLYEQAAGTSDDDATYVTIDYTLTIGGYTGNHSIKVPFKQTTDNGTYVPVERNHLYKIVLGNGSEINGAASLTAKVLAWDEEDEEFTLEF